MLQAERDGLLIILLGALALMAALAALAFGLLAAPIAVGPVVPLTVTVGGATPLPERPRGSSPGGLPILPTSTLLDAEPSATVEIVTPTEAATITPAVIVITPTVDPILALTLTAVAGTPSATPTATPPGTPPAPPTETPPGAPTETPPGAPTVTPPVPPPVEPTVTPPGYPGPPVSPTAPPQPTPYP